MDPSPHILIVDDHRDIRDLLARFLAKHGFRATTAEDAARARKVLETNAIDLVVLDIMMPGEDGLALCRSLRATDGPPVILLTAMAEETDRVVGLEMGADDYVVKPFNPRELVARIKAVLRRAGGAPRRGQAPKAAEIRFGQWRLLVGRQELVGADGVAVPLSGGEFQLLTVLLERPQRVLGRDQLLDLTRGRTAAPFDRSIDNLVSRLRKKIEADPKRPTLIKTVWGGGYMLAAEVEHR